MILINEIENVNIQKVCTYVRIRRIWRRKQAASKQAKFLIWLWLLALAFGLGFYVEKLIDV